MTRWRNAPNAALHAFLALQANGRFARTRIKVSQAPCLKALDLSRELFAKEQYWKLEWRVQESETQPACRRKSTCVVMNSPLERARQYFQYREVALDRTARRGRISSNWTAWGEASWIRTSVGFEGRAAATGGDRPDLSEATRWSERDLSELGRCEAVRAGILQAAQPDNDCSGIDTCLPTACWNSTWLRKRGRLARCRAKWLAL